MRNETKLRVMAEVGLSEVISELSVSDLAEIMDSFVADDIADAILTLPEAKIEKIRNLIKDEE
jgi:mgtE intracellular N domain